MKIKRYVPKTVRILSLLLLALCISYQSFSQITLYTRTVLTGQVYTPIVGGTVINTNAQLGTGTQDDGGVVVTLPFAFTYDNINYNQVTFCTNGWIAMNNQLSTTTAVAGRTAGNLFTTTAPNNTICAFFGDGGANFPTGNGAMVHGTVAPGVYAFEWRNACAVGFTQSSVNTISYMIKIYGNASANPGRIELLYGPNNGSAASTGRSIGIEDAVGGANRFINALNGSFTSTATNTAWPGNGNGYRFDPPPPCSAMPANGSISAPLLACPGVPFSMTLNGATVAYGITYQWQSKPSSGGSFTNIAGATNTTLSTTISVPTDFRCLTTCVPTSQTAIAPTVSIGMNTFYNCYCKNGISGGTGASIDSVSIVRTTLKKASPGSAPTFYTLYPASGNTTASLQAGGLYYLYVKYGSVAIGSVWLDANQNGTFEASEWTQINTNGNEGLVALRVPPGAVTGLTGLRIRSANTGSTNGSGNACTAFTSGETEDYVVNITPAPVKDVSIVTLLNPAPVSALCPFKPIAVKALVYNFGSTAQTNFPITTVLNGPAPVTNVMTYAKTLAPFTADTVLLTSYTLAVTGAFNVQSSVSLPGDLNPLNDSSLVHYFNIKPNANVPVPRHDSVCYGQEAVLHVLPDTFTHVWYSDPNYTNLVFTGDTLRIPNIQKDSFLYVGSKPKTVAGASLTTINAPNNGCTAGAMFEIIPSKNMSIDSFASLFTNTGVQTVNVYYRVGTYLGFENNAAAWTLLGTTSVNATSTTAYQKIDVGTRLQVTAGQTYGIFLNYNARYTNGTNSWSNSDLTLNAGAGHCTAFSGAIAGRMFNGTVYYSTGPAACESPLLPINAYAGPKPIVNLGTDLYPCEDMDVILDGGFAGGSYLWNTLETTQTISVKNKTGKFWVEVNKYCTNSDTVELFLQPKASGSGISYSRIGNQYIFNVANPSNIQTIQWIFGDGQTDYGTYTPKHTYATSGLYKVLCIIGNNCGYDTLHLIIPMGVPKTNSADNIVLYPNPANDKLTLDFNNSVHELTAYEIVNNLGSVVLKQQDVKLNSGKLNIDIHSLPTGNYIIKLITADNSLSKQFIINR